MKKSPPFKTNRKTIGLSDFTRTRFLFFGFILFFTTLSFGQGGTTQFSNENSEASWKINTSTSIPLDTALLANLLQKLTVERHEIDGFVLAKNDQILVESYFNGFQDTAIHDLRSVTKSILSLLIGIALDRGFIQNVNDPISKYLNQFGSIKHLDPLKNTITIKHLLTMSGGLDCNDWDKKSKGQEDKVYRQKDWIQYTLDLPLIHLPGTVSAYCSMGTVLLAEIISQASGLSIDQFALTYLFNPLKIERAKWGYTSDREVIPSGKRLYMAPKDLLKIGLLVLNKGRWNGSQIVSEVWISESTTPKTKITGVNYSYLWWNIPLQASDTSGTAITATGNGGQYVMIFPDLDVVAVFTGSAFNSEQDKLPFSIMQRVVLPALKSS